MIDAEVGPRVSVVVPNRNYEAFLPQRIESILGQTYRDLEVVVADDASTDGSVRVVARYVDPRVRVVRNAKPSGNPFHQWRRGIACTQGRYVWIAESDDYAHPRLLERLVAMLDAHPNVGIAYCSFWRVDELGAVEDMSEIWWRDLDCERWRQDFVAPGEEELRWLSCWNVISNASGVVFRRSVYDAVGGVDDSYRLAGDWDLWIRMARRSDVGFIAEPLNYWRWHGGTMRMSTARAGVARREVERVLGDLARSSGTAAEVLIANYHRHHVESALRWRNAPLARQHAVALLRRRPCAAESWRLALHSGLLSAQAGLRVLRAT